MEPITIAFLFISIMFCAFFSGVEIAYISSNKLKFELDKKQKHLGAILLSPVFRNPQRFIGTMLVGNNVALVVYSMITASLLEPFLNRFTHSNLIVLLLQTLISTSFILIFAEFLPKIIFKINSNRTLNYFSIIIVFFYYLLYLPVTLITYISEIFLKIFLGVKFNRKQPVFRRTDLDHYLEEVSMLAEKHDEELDTEIKIFKNALDFSSIKARECMVPRNEIVAVDVESSTEELKTKFIETGLSKTMIYRDNIDNIIGYTHLFELFKKPDSIKNILLPVSVVPESMSASEILELFIKNKRSIVVVVDEFGGTAGIVTMEDIIEELFGEIQDEHDAEEMIENKISEKEYEFSARLEIDYLNEKYRFGLPVSDDYETLAGLIYNLCESIPQKGETIVKDKFKFVIKRVSDNKINLVRLNLLK